MKTLTFTLFFVFSCCFGFAQNRQIIDSLNHQLVVTQQDTSRVLIICELVTQYRLINADSALMYVRLKYQQVLPTTFRNLGRVQAKKGNYRSALEYYRQSLNADSNGTRTQEYNAYIYNLMGDVYQKMNQTDSCIFYAKQALIYAESVQKKRRNIESYTLLADAYKTKKDFEKAFNYQQLLDATRESLYGAGNTQAIQTLLSQDQEQQKQLEIEKVTYQAQLRQTTFLVGLGVFLLISFILYRTNRKQKEANEILHRQKEEINTQRIELKQSLETLKSTQSQLIQSEKLASLGELTAGIAHEIQNPLNFVNNFSELSVELAKELKEEIKKPDKDWELIEDLTSDLEQNQEKINHHGKRAASIVKGMLEHSKVSTGKKEPTDINALVDEYSRLAYSNLRSKNNDSTVAIETHLEDSLPHIDLIPQDIGRVVLNLINNAFWAVKTVEKPLVTIKTEKADHQVIIKVSDNGIGMSEATKAKIFQPFFTTKPTGEGTGLGLSLAYDIVTKGHGGTMEVESVEREGATFIVKLPI